MEIYNEDDVPDTIPCRPMETLSDKFRREVGEFLSGFVEHFQRVKGIEPLLEEKPLTADDFSVMTNNTIKQKV